jgi:hypothetical protein
VKIRRRGVQFYNHITNLTGLIGIVSVLISIPFLLQISLIQISLEKTSIDRFGKAINCG